MSSDDPEERACQNMNIFPWQYPGIFTNIIDFCDGIEILGLRLVCTDWRNWITDKVDWARLAKKLARLARSQPFDVSIPTTNMFSLHRVLRLCHVMEGDGESRITRKDYMRLVLTITKCHRQLKLNLIPRVTSVSRVGVRALLELSNTKFLGPIVLHLRLKVDHPVVREVVREMVCRYLPSLLVDKEHVDNPRLRALIYRSLSEGQNWIFQHFDPPKREDTDETKEPVNYTEGKRKIIVETDAPPLKRSKFDVSTSRSSSQSLPNEDVKKDDDDDDDEDEDMFEALPHTVYQFPTLDDLIDVDHPTIRRVLSDRCYLDRILLVPQIESFLFHQHQFPSLRRSELDLVGWDGDRTVCSVNPRQFVTMDRCQMGYIESPPNSCVYPTKEELHFWGRKDIRNRWPAFERQLSSLDAKAKAEKAGTSSAAKQGNSLPSPILYCFGSDSGQQDKVEPSTSSSDGGPTPGADLNLALDDKQAQVMLALAERGISVTVTKNKRPSSDPPRDGESSQNAD